MAFDDQYVAPMDRSLCTVFNVASPNNNIPAPVLHPQDGSPDITLTTITARPGMDEDFIPGSLQNTNVERLFVSFRDLSPIPQKGDTITWNQKNYDVFEVTADRCGGAVLKIRSNGTALL